LSQIHRFLSIEILYISVLSVVLGFIGFLPSPSFDDVFMKNTALLPYFDFRPGYPPLGKLPVYFLFICFDQTLAYSLLVFFMNLLGFFVMGISLYLCIRKLSPRRASGMALMVLMMPSIIYFNLIYSHADAFSIAFMLLALYFIKNVWLCGALSSVGALLKLFPAVLVLPLAVYYKGLRKRITFLYSFLLVSLLLSIPFLMEDPLMYASVVISHSLRGPAESIFAIIDGYSGHTGFIHPTFDAAIYSWQYARIYTPSTYDHHRYKWNIPVLPYLSLALQILFIVAISWIAKSKNNRKQSTTLISLAMFSYFAFSTFYNPFIHIIQLPLLVLATLNWKLSTQIGVVLAFEIINIIHSMLWFSPLLWFVGTQFPLSLVIILRTILYGLVFLNFARRRGV